MPAYEADLERFAGYDAQVLGISVDSVPCNTAWAKSLGGLSYDLLSDFHPKGEVAKAYGAYRANDGISERALFIVDKEGKLAYKDIHNIADQPDNEDLLRSAEEVVAVSLCVLCGEYFVKFIKPQRTERSKQQETMTISQQMRPFHAVRS